MHESIPLPLLLSFHNMLVDCKNNKYHQLIELNDPQKKKCGDTEMKPLDCM